MIDLVSHIDAFLKKYEVDKVIVACSAGLDSTVLLHTCSKLKFSIEIAHVNYQLRGEESDKDQSFLEQLASTLSIPIHIKRIDLKEQLTDGGNLQEKARIERYNFFQSLTAREERTYILLAHHSEDQTETFFMNMARSSGVMGLAAMPEKRGRYLRPMLGVSKGELKQYAQKNHLEWREDSSNASLKYTRNEWRNVILPELRKQIPNLDNSVSILTGEFQEKQLVIERKVNTITARIFNTHTLLLDTFQSMDMLEKVELCRQLGQPIGILESWSRLKHKGTEIELNAHEKFPYYKLVFEGDSFSFLTSQSVQKWNINKESVSILPKEFNKSEIYLDSGTIQGKLQLRKIQTGDRIHPIGMRGSRLVSDVISDAKLTSIEKEQLYLLVDDQHILWVPELCVSRKAIASKQSKEIFKVRLNLLFE